METRPPSSSVRAAAAETIPTAERLILALDVPTVDEAKALVEKLGSLVGFYKIGLQLAMTGQYFELLEWLRARGKKVFADLKLFDVPETVKNAVRGLQRWDAQFLTVHGHDQILEAAAAEKGNLKILAVTVLTSFDQRDLKDMGYKVDVTRLVLSRARRARAIGCDGVISSALEAAKLRRSLAEPFLIVTPGIRPPDPAEAQSAKPKSARKSPRQDDQKRVATIEQAFRNGADYIVVGRPILKATDPVTAAAAMQRQIAALFS